MVIEAVFAQVKDFSDGLAAVRPKKSPGMPYNKGDEWGYVDKTGKYAIEPKFNQALSFKNGIARVHEGGTLETTSFHAPPHWKGGKWKWIDKSGKVVRGRMPADAKR